MCWKEIKNSCVFLKCLLYLLLLVIQNATINEKLWKFSHRNIIASKLGVFCKRVPFSIPRIGLQCSKNNVFPARINPFKSNAICRYNCNHKFSRFSFFYYLSCTIENKKIFANQRIYPFDILWLWLWLWLWPYANYNAMKSLKSAAKDETLDFLLSNCHLVF